MINKLFEGLQQAGEVLKEQAGNISGMTKEKTYEIIEDWLKIFPQLQKAGLEVTSFGLSIALSPSLEVEMLGNHDDFTDEKIKEILENNEDSRAMSSVMSAIKTTYNLYQKAEVPMQEPLLVRLSIKMPPEVNVFIGTPQIFK